MSAFGTGSNSNGQFWFGGSTFPGFLYKKNPGGGGRRSTKFNPGGNILCNKSTNLYNQYKPGGGGVGASSVSNRRAKNRLATICGPNQCFPCYTTLGQYSKYTHNPNGYVQCIEGPIPIPNPGSILPLAPINLSATVSPGSVSISFTQPNNDGGPILNYEYDLLDLTRGTFIPFDPPQNTSPVVIRGLENETSYSVILRAVNANGAGASSSPITFTTPIAPTFIITYALPGDGEAYIYFTKDPLIPIGDISNYEYTTNGGTTWTALSPLDKDTPILITGLTNGTTYNIKIRAIITSVPSVASNAISVTPQAGTTPAESLYYDPNNVASYPGTGSTVSNIGSFGTLNGTTMGTTFVTGTGITRNVFDFNGSSRIEFGQYNFGSSFTISAWVYPRNKFSINGLIANAGAGLSTNGFKLGWNFWQTQNKTMLFEAGNNFQGGAVGTLENTVIDNSWQYLTYIVDVTNQRALFLRNGIPVDTFIGSDNTTVANISTNNPKFNVGAFTDPSYFMNAQLGYIKIYNGVLSVGDIQNDYNNSKASFGL
jgi:hypothetical protein